MSFNVLRSSISTTLLAAMLATASGAACLVSGCADVITYANDSRKAGIEQYDKGNYPEAAGSFRNAIRQDPTDYLSEFYLGQSYEAMKDNHLAIDAYKVCLRQMPKSNQAHYDPALHEKAFDRIAQVVAASDVSHTETDLIQRTAAERNDPEQYRLLGRIARLRGDADTAVQNYRTSVSLKPRDFDTQKELGLYLAQLNQTQDAANVLKAAYQLNPNDAQVNDALRQLGMVPGPGLLNQDQLARPLIPNGPLPDLLTAPRGDAPAAQ